MSSLMIRNARLSALIRGHANFRRCDYPDSNQNLEVQEKNIMNISEMTCCIFLAFEHRSGKRIVVLRNAGRS